MKAIPPERGSDQNVQIIAAADAAAELVQDGMIVGLGNGSTDAFAVDALARRYRQGLRFLGIPTSKRTAALAKAAGIPLAPTDERRQIDITIAGAHEVQLGALDLIKGRSGVLLREKIVAAASRRLAIIADNTHFVDQLGLVEPVPVEVAAFGLEATGSALEVLGSSARLRLSSGSKPYVTDNGNHIIDYRFGPIADPARLEQRIKRIVGVVERGLFVGRADVVFVADKSGGHRLDSTLAHRSTPPVLVVMGVSGAVKSTIAQEVATRLGWCFKEGDSLHPGANVAKMRAGIPLTDADRQPWLERVAAWIDAQRAKRLPGIITCSALKRSYRQIIIGDRSEARLVYLRGDRDLLARRLAARGGHFMPSSLLQSQMDTLEEPDPSEFALTFEVGPPAAEIAGQIIRLIRASAADGSPEQC